MAEWQDDLPPLVREKLARIGDASPEEKARMKELSELDSLLADFFGGAVDPEGLYERLKQYQDQGKQFLLQEAQARLKGSFKERESRIAFGDAGAGGLTVRLLEEEEAEGAVEEEQEGAVLELTEDNFDDAVRKHRVLVVDCWAEWCAPCRMVAPIIEELAREYRGTIAFGKLDVDRNPTVAAKYSIMSIPTLLVFKDWQLADQMVGAQPKQMLQQRLASYID
jgi:thioredoxin 1